MAKSNNDGGPTIASIPLALGGQATAGDPATLPPDVTRLLQNYLPRPNRFARRAPFVYDNLMHVNGLANFNYAANAVEVAVALDASHSLYAKGSGAGSETWSSAVTGIASGTRLTDYANFFFTTYGMLDDGSATALPTQAFSFDGNVVSTTPFNTAIASRTITSFDERVFLAYPRATFIAWMSDIAYRVTGLGTWTLTNLNASNLTVGSLITGRVSPTSTAAGACSMISTNPLTLSPSASKDWTWMRQFRGVDPTYRVPFALEWLIVAPPNINTAYALGNLMTSGGFLYRTTTAGTSAAVAPAYTAVPGATTADNTVVWTNIGTDIISALEDYVPSLSAASTPSTFVLPVRIPDFTNATLQFFIRIKFYNTETPALTTLAPVDFSYRDGITDGDPTKNCFGQQVTEGDFIFPFFNQESTFTTTQNLNHIVWSELRQPKRILNANYYKPQGFIGYPTAACAIANRYLVWYRNGFIQFQATSDPDNPIRAERSDYIIGCLGPLAHDEIENTTFFVGESDIYQYTAGDAAPTPITGELMREEIMQQGSDWVESQSTYNRPLLHIDKSDRLLLFVYTQKSKLYVYDLRTQRWATWTLPNSAELSCMSWNINTGNMYFGLSSATYGLARVDYDLEQQDTIESTVINYPCNSVITYRPVEYPGPPRADLKFLRVWLWYNAPSAQTDQTFTIEYSIDQGKTYPKSITGTLDTTGADDYVPLVLDAMGWVGPSLTIRTTYSGKAGEGLFALSSRGYVEAEVMSVEYPQVRHLAVTSVVGN